MLVPRCRVRSLMVDVAAISVALGGIAWLRCRLAPDQMWILLGPIVFVQDVSTENQVWGIVLLLLLPPFMILGVVRPGFWTILIGMFAALAWTYLGRIGTGIGC